MRRVVAVVIAAGLVAAAGSTTSGSSHREAPGIAKTPKVDGTDFYLFRSYQPGRSEYVTFLANYIGLEDTYGGPNFFMLEENAAYEIHVDNNGNGIEDLTFQFQFQRTQKNLAVPVGGLMTAVPLINIGGIGPGRDDTGNLNVLESYTLSIVRGPRRTGARDPVTDLGGGTTFKKPVDRIGDKSLQDNNPTAYETYANDHIYDIKIPGCTGQGRVFVGQRREGFVVNLAEVFDLVNLNPLGPENAEINTLANKNVTTLALEVPISCVVAASPVIGAWTTSSVGVGAPAAGGRTPNPGDTAPCPPGMPASLNPGPTFVPTQDCMGWVPPDHPLARGGSGSVTTTTPAGAFSQVSRLGLPLVNELVIGLPDKDKFNASEPKDDAQFLQYVTHPSLPVLIQSLFGVPAPPPPRNDLVSTYLTGIAGLNMPPNVQPAEMLRLNTSTVATPEGSQNRLGVLGGDMAGFPNGRRPGDDIVDATLRVAEGILLLPAPARAAFPALTDGAFSNATVGYNPDGSLTTDPSFRLYQNAFPYLRVPLSGSPNPTHQ